MAVDRKGNRSNIAETLLVTTQKDTVLSLTTDKTRARADGSDAIVVTLHLTDRSGTALVNQDVTWKTSGGQLSATSGRTDSNGNATIRLTSAAAGSFTVSAGTGNKTAGTGDLTFTAEMPTATIAVDKTSVTANNTDAATFTVTVKNAADQPVANQTVTWATNFGTLSAASGNTDANGQLQMKLTSGTAGQATVIAAVAGQTLTAPVVTFTVQSSFGQPSLDVPTVSSSEGPVINITSSFTTVYTTSYSNMLAGDIITLSFDGVDINGVHHTFTDEHTISAADASRGSVAMGPYPGELYGIQTQGPSGKIRDNGTFTSTVRRPSTGESKSVSVTVTIDTQ